MPLRAFQALAVLSLACAAGCGGGSGTQTPAPTAPSPGFVINNLDEMLSEKVLGLEGVPITIITYSSLTCPHCATVHLTTLPQVKRSYIDTHQARYVYRDFPVAGAATTAVAVAASALARCAGNQRYFEALDLLYAAQGTWTRSPDPVAAMKQALGPIGMASAQMEACLASVPLRDGIERQRSDGQATHGVTATPAVLVNGRRATDDSFAGLTALLLPLTPPASTCRNACHRID